MRARTRTQTRSCKRSTYLHMYAYRKKYWKREMEKKQSGSILNKCAAAALHTTTTTTVTIAHHRASKPTRAHACLSLSLSRDTNKCVCAQTHGDGERRFLRCAHTHTRTCTRCIAHLSVHEFTRIYKYYELDIYITICILINISARKIEKKNCKHSNANDSSHLFVLT